MVPAQRPPERLLPHSGNPVCMVAEVNLGVEAARTCCCNGNVKFTAAGAPVQGLFGPCYRGSSCGPDLLLLFLRVAGRVFLGNRPLVCCSRAAILRPGSEGKHEEGGSGTDGELDEPSSQAVAVEEEAAADGLEGSWSYPTVVLPASQQEGSSISANPGPV